MKIFLLLILSIGIGFLLQRLVYTTLLKNKGFNEYSLLDTFLHSLWIGMPLGGWIVAMIYMHFRDNGFFG